MTLGQEFNSFASTIAADLGFLEQVAQRFYTCNMGGTAIGTGIAATTGYSRACLRHLRSVPNLRSHRNFLLGWISQHSPLQWLRLHTRHRVVTGLPMVIAEDLIEETANTGGFLAFSGVLR
mgnify:CR=1 FL=1|jgi:aspartate ammonia-lyase